MRQDAGSPPSSNWFGVRNQTVGQAHRGRDPGTFRATEYVRQLGKGKQCRVVHDIRRLRQNLDDRLGGVIRPQAFGLSKPEDRTNVLEDLLRGVTDASLLDAIDDAGDHCGGDAAYRQLSEHR
jgi:hypothetical protein